MKNTLLASLAITAIFGSLSSTQAATLFAASVDRGFVLSNGTTPLTSGTIRFGTFATGTNFAGDAASLEAAFTQIVTSTGPFSYGGNPGLFELTGDENAPLSFVGGTTVYEGIQYDLTTSGIDLSNPGDLAGTTIYMWLLNSDSTQQAILSTSEIWQDSQSPVDNFFDTGTATLHVGSVSTTTLAGTTTPAYQLANAGVIPEPSRAVLGLLGLALAFFRRRRA